MSASTSSRSKRSASSKELETLITRSITLRVSPMLARPASALRADTSDVQIHRKTRRFGPLWGRAKTFRIPSRTPRIGCKISRLHHESFWSWTIRNSALESELTAIQPRARFFCFRSTWSWFDLAVTRPTAPHRSHASLPALFLPGAAPRRNRQGVSRVREQDVPPFDTTTVRAVTRPVAPLDSHRSERRHSRRRPTRVRSRR